MPRPTRWNTVLRTATALFAANGFGAATVSQVARRARLSKPGLYYHVRDKEELLFRICDYSMAGILAGARAAVAAAGDPAEQLRELIRAHTAFHWQHPNNLAILFGQGKYLSAARRRRVAAMERQYLELVRGVIREGQRRRRFRRVDPTVAAFSLFAMLNTLDGWYDVRGRIRPRDLVEEMGRLYLSGLAVRDGRAPTPRPRLPRGKPRKGGSP
ncbi:MAG TPA: TetR/AcrR family transcriptional regulator [Candidatus Deferrimicrobiaceae bacterium]|nr:TetR/AcrR family transcriptional regulator [Candidatus Deferrimicrobiaceae bacterium]